MIARASSRVSALRTMRAGPKISSLGTRMEVSNCFGAPQNYVLVALHVGGSFDDGRTDPVTIGECGNFKVTSVQVDPAALLFSRSNETDDALLGCRRDDWAKVGTLLKALIDLQLLRTFDEFWQPRLCGSDKDNYASSYVSIADEQVS